MCIYVNIYTFKIGAQFFNTVLAVYHCMSLVRYIDYCHSVFSLFASVDKSPFRVFTRIVIFPFALFFRLRFPSFSLFLFSLPFFSVVGVVVLILCLYGQLWSVGQGER